MTTLKCEICGCIELLELTGPPVAGLYYCSEHHPDILKWHGKFEKQYNTTDFITLNAPGISLSIDI